MTDRATVQTVVRLLGLLALVCVGGLIFLADRGNLTDGVSTALVGLAGAAAGGVAGLLAKTDSVDVDGLDAIAYEQGQNFLPVLQAKLDDARREGEQRALASVVPVTLESTHEGYGDPVPAAASADLAQQLEAVSTSTSDVEFDVGEPGEPPDPTDHDQPLQPTTE